MAKRWIGSALALALIVAAGAFAALAFQNNDAGVAAQTDENQDRRTVSVSGNGQVSMQPDTGYFSVGVEVTAETADEALAESNETVEAVTAALLDAGVAEDDLTLGSFSIWPEYDYNNNSDEKPELRGFRVSHQLSVTVRDIEQTGSLLSTAVEAGANTVNSVTFGVEDSSAALDQARERAFENARHKAEELARLSEGSLGPIVSISENSYTPGPVERYAGEDEAADSGASAVPINPGDSTFTVDVQVVWELN
ncbi:MAG: SIMPL domain-containing protein [Thermomicrobiales bacterium]